MSKKIPEWKREEIQRKAEAAKLKQLVATKKEKLTKLLGVIDGILVEARKNQDVEASWNKRLWAPEEIDELDNAHFRVSRVLSGYIRAKRR